jgi:hypothetical protein
VISTDFLVGMLAPIIDVDQLSAEIFADLGRPLNRFPTSFNPLLLVHTKSVLEKFKPCAQNHQCTESLASSDSGRSRAFGRDPWLLI